ncbi:MAG: hypothetical protein ACTTJH_07295 [Bacteroidales bacterium]
MKKVKVLLVVALAMATTSVMSQSGIWLEGNILFNNTKQKDIATTNMFGLEIGGNYNLDRHLSIGLNIGDEFWKIDRKGLVKNIDKANLFMITPHATYSTKLFKSLYWTPRFNVTYGFGTRTNEAGAVKTDQDLQLIEFKLQPLAFEYKLNSKCALGMTLSFADMYFNFEQIGSRETTTVRFPLSKYNNHLVSATPSDDIVLGNIGINFSFRYYL